MCLSQEVAGLGLKPSTCPCRHCISTASNLGRLFLRLSSSFWVKLLLASCFHRYAEVNGKLRNHFRNVIVEPRPIGTPSFSNSISQTSRISRLRMRVVKRGGAGWLLLCFSCLQKVLIHVIPCYISSIRSFRTFSSQNI